jgi:isopenicillin N synthase-like dioxygenase
VIVYTPPRPPTSIPVVDLAGSFSSRLDDRQRVAWEIHKACRETGFFYVSNHRSSTPSSSARGASSLCRSSASWRST